MSRRRPSTRTRAAIRASSTTAGTRATRAARCRRASPSSPAPTRRSRDPDMTSPKAYVLIGLLALLAGCQSPSRPAQSSAPEDGAAMAASALAGGRYADALELYRQALADAPAKVGLHYGLGVASSYLDRRDDAVREFRWVVQYGPQTVPEVAAARQWLIQAGALLPAHFAKPASTQSGQ